MELLAVFNFGIVENLSKRNLSFLLNIKEEKVAGDIVVTKESIFLLMFIRLMGLLLKPTTIFRKQQRLTIQQLVIYVNVIVVFYLLARDTSFFLIKT
jgi:hypothetical protein